MKTIEIDSKRLTSIKIGDTIFVNEITKVSEWDLLKNSSPFILGGGNNLLIAPNADNLVILGNEFDYICDFGEILEVGANCLGKKLFNYAQANNLSGFEILQSIPGKIGGLVKMNAGAKEFEIKQNLLGILISQNDVGEFGEFSAEKDLSRNLAECDKKNSKSIESKNENHAADSIDSIDSMKSKSIESQSKNFSQDSMNLEKTNALKEMLKAAKARNLAFVPKNALKMQYRKTAINTMIFAAIFAKKSGFSHALVAHLTQMRANQPKGANFGSCFKNPNIIESSANFTNEISQKKAPSAGKLLEEAGLKGHKFGTFGLLGFSEKHANFLINSAKLADFKAARNPSFEDALLALRTARAAVLENSGILLEPEVQIIGAKL